MNRVPVKTPRPSCACGDDLCRDVRGAETVAENKSAANNAPTIAAAPAWHDRPKPAKRPIVDDRFRFGKQAPCMSIKEDGAVGRTILFCHISAGYPHDRDLALAYLKPGHIYTISALEVESSSSRVQVAEFENVWFNTVLFTDWPGGVA